MISTTRSMVQVLLGIAIVAAASPSPRARATEVQVWRIDSTTRVAGHPVERAGAPKVVDDGGSTALEFDGVDDGVFVDANPLEGLARFTVEVTFRPAAGGPEEQRFLHIQEHATEDRVLVELRMGADGRWCLDTFLRDGDHQLTLIDRTRLHAADRWHTVALAYDGRVMSHYVDGVRQGSGEVQFAPLGAGRTSIGVRQNRVSWFKGQIREVRITPEALPADRLQRVAPIIPLWPEGVPGLRADAGPERLDDGRVTNVHVPTLSRVDPDGAPNGTAVIVCPGGGYGRLAIANEGDGVTRVLRARGVTTFVLKYRLAEYGHPAPLQDVLRAIRLVRSHAAEWGLAPDRIGLMGASAGGHLAAAAATLYDSPEGRTGAALDQVNARPDFVALLYPVITMQRPLAHEASRRNLLGENPSPALVEAMSLENRVTASTPPMFIVHAAEDKSVPLEHSLRFHEALRTAGVPVELHLYERGAHGFGTSPGLGQTSSWPDRWMDWMTAHGWLPVAGSHNAALWARGIEGQRKADLGNGTFLNPILAGDRPDPSILKDGADYYMTFSSFDAYPGLVIWHSRDLVNWQPRQSALVRNVGSVWAPELLRHGSRYYIYFHARTEIHRAIYAIWADSIDGPWSDPVDLGLTQIDPGHAVDDSGRRYLFLSGGQVAPLSPDGLKVSGPVTKVYDGWHYPEDWVVESFSQEGPKILRHGAYFYMVLAEGGTAGPPTGHMVVSARARKLEGPWENSPYNPILRTRSVSERWWSKGHGTLVEGPNGQWYMVYHAYENGFYTLGRQTLLEPIEWTNDGWFRMAGYDAALPIPMPGGESGPHGIELSDDFSTDRMGLTWSFYKGTAADQDRVRRDGNALVLRATGSTPADSKPLGVVATDHAYEVEVEIDADPSATAGLVLFYNSRLYAGIGFSASNFVLHRYGTERLQPKPAGVAGRLHLRLRNDRHIVTIDYSTDGKTWTRFGTGMEVSGYHHNVAYDFLSLKPAIYAAGSGDVRFRNFRYRALP